MAQKYLIEDDDWDFAVSHLSKRVIAIALAITGNLIWLLYSTPNTIDFCIRFTKGISVLSFNFGGIVLGVVAGMAFSIFERVFTYLTIWKKCYWFMIIVFICATISILATFKFITIGQQQAQIKVDTIGNSEMIITNLQEAVKEAKKHYDQYFIEEEDYKRTHQGYVPPYISARRREAKELYLSKVDELNNAIQKSTNIKQDIGAIVTIDPLEGKQGLFSILLAVILEFFIIIGDIVSVALYKKIRIENRIITESNQSYEPNQTEPNLSNLANVGQFTTEPKPSIVLLKTEPKTNKTEVRPIGFGRNNNEPNKTELRVNSVDAILMIYDHYKEINQSITKKEIANMIGCTDTWVRTVLKNNNRN